MSQTCIRLVPDGKCLSCRPNISDTKAFIQKNIYSLEETLRSEPPLPLLSFEHRSDTYFSNSGTPWGR